MRPLAVCLELPLVVITVDLNDETPSWANEVDDKAADGLLPLEILTGESAGA